MTMRMKKLFSILAVAATVLLTACDEHQDFPDTAMKVTHILTTDGKVMPYETYEQSCKQAIAVVFNVNQREEMEGNGYAVYLWDIAPEAFADSIGVEQDTSCDLTAYDGNKNTFALYGTTDVKCLWLSVSSTCGVTGKVPISPVWHRCVCSIMPRTSSTHTS